MRKWLSSCFIFLSFCAICQEPTQVLDIEEEMENAPPQVSYFFHVSANTNDSCFQFNFENRDIINGDTIRTFLSHVKLSLDTIRQTFNYNNSYNGGRRIYQIIYYPNCLGEEPVVIRFHEFDGTNYPEVVFHSLPKNPGYYEPSFESSTEIINDYYRHYHRITKEYNWRAIPFVERKLSMIKDETIEQLLSY